MPPGATAAPGEPVAWPRLIEQWVLIEWDFQHTLQLDAEQAIFARSWRWFSVRVAGLLSTRGTALNAYFHPPDDEKQTEVPHE
jgi:hypothetical protein